MAYAQQLAARRAQTKAAKVACAGLLVKISTSATGTVLNGHSDELLRAQAKLEAAGFETVGNYGHMLWVCHAAN